MTIAVGDWDRLLRRHPALDPNASVDGCREGGRNPPVDYPARNGNGSLTAQTRRTENPGRTSSRCGRRFNRRNPQRSPMSKVLVLYYSSYGHIETMAQSRGGGCSFCGSHRRHQARPLKRFRKISPKAPTSSSIRRRPSRPSPNCPNTTQSLSGPRHALAVCLHRWRASWTRPAACGRVAL